MDIKDCELVTETVTSIDLVCPVAHSRAVLDWIYANGGSTRRTGPRVVNYRALPDSFHVIGHIAGVWTRAEIEKAIRAL